MDWSKINIYTAPDGVDLLCAFLTDIGINGFEIKDPRDFNDFLRDKNGKWDYIDNDLMSLADGETCVTVYLPGNSRGADMLAALRSLLGRLKRSDKDNIYGSLDIEISGVREEDWANNWKKFFRPLKTGEKLVIKPSWEEYSCDDGRIILEIDPASSFGTGQHQTTGMCLELIEKNLREGDKVLDIGCGSGILSIAAMLLGADSAVAVDIEENAVVTARENAAKNSISPEKYKVCRGDILSDGDTARETEGKYDLILANIVADVIISMKDIFAGYMKNDGKLIVSGIIDGRRDETVSELEKSGLKVIEIKEAGGWVAATFSLSKRGQ